MNGCVYHHSSSQTPTVKKEPKDTSNLRTRETQTFQTRTLAVQSYRESGE
jgi:ribosomal protein S30